MKEQLLNKSNLNKYLIPIGFIVLNFVLKIIFLDESPVGNDEPFSVFVAQMKVPYIISHLSLGNNPPFFEILLHFWIQIFGISAFSIRFLPFIFSTLTVLFVYKTGRSFFNIRVAILGALIFTFTDYHIYFAHEARVYSMFALLTAISMFEFLSLIKNKESKLHMVVLVVVNILLIYSHFFGLIIPAIQTISLLLFREARNGILKKYFLMLSVLIIAYIPYINILFTRFIDSGINGTWITPSELSDLYTMLWRFSNAPVTTVIFLAFLLAAFLKWAINRSDKINIFTKIILFWFLFPYMFMFAISMKYLPFNLPVFFDRYVVFISLAFYLIVAISVDYVFASLKYRDYFISLPAVIIILTCNPDAGNKRDIPALVNKVKELKTNKSVVYICPKWYDLNFAYYYNLEYFRAVNNQNLKSDLIKLLANENIYFLYGFNEIDSIQMKTADKIILVGMNADFYSLEEQATDYLKKFFPNQATYTYSDVYSVNVNER